MDVDVSPDGKTLVFNLLGDLYTIPSAGGEATQITRGLALNVKPVWSPDGKRIAYISDFSGTWHLNVRDVSGPFHNVLGRSDRVLNEATYTGASAYPRTDLYIEWTHDGNYISVAEFIYDLAGNKIPLKGKFENLLRFSRDGRSFCYFDADTIFRYDYETNERTMVAPVSGRSISGELSPDNHYWAYVIDSNKRKCLVVRDLVNNAERVLASSLMLKCPVEAQFYNSHYAFSPDSKYLFIGYGGKIHRINIESGEDQVLPFTVHVKSDLGPRNYNTFHVSMDSVKIRYTRSANASPDGKHLVFSALSRLYMMDLPGGKAHVINPQDIGQFQPVFSRDGKWIAYVSWCDTIGGALWRVPASGGRPEQLSHIAGQYQRPSWSPDGRSIAVIRGEPKFGDRDDPGMGQLELISVNGGRVTTIADSIPLWNNLSFSADGQRVSYLSFFEVKNHPPLLVSKDLDGKNLRVEANALAYGMEDNVQQRALSPDGRYIVYSSAEDLYLVWACKLSDSTFMCDPNEKLTVIRFANGVDPYWEKGGKCLSWSYGNKFYRIDPDKIILQAGHTKQAPGNKFTIVRIKPDQVINLDVTVPHYYAHGTIALKNVRILTMQGDKVIEDGTVVIRNGRFTAVGPTNKIPIPAGAKILDLSGKTVMPGMLDLHLHMRLQRNIIPQQSWMYLANLAYGVTTAQDPSSSYDSYGCRELLESGQMIGPRLYSSGKAVCLIGAEAIVKVDNLDDATAIAQKRALLGGTFVKQYMLPTRIQRQWLLMASRKAGLNMTNEGGDLPLFVNFGMVKDGSTGVEHDWAWGDEYKDVLTMIVKSGTYLTPTLQTRPDDAARQYLNYTYWSHPDAKMMRFQFSNSIVDPNLVSAESLETISKFRPADTTYPGVIYGATVDAEIRKEGGDIVVGAHGNDEGIGTHNELWALQRGGLTNMQALQEATIIGARSVGIQNDIGSIEVGKIADLIILNKNPLDDIHNSREIRYVMKEGILYDGDTLDTIWPFQRKCPEWKMKNK